MQQLRELTSVVAGRNYTDIVSSDSADRKLLGRCFLPTDCIDAECVKQLQNMCTHPAVSHARIMPDCHKGNGCCIGFTSKLTRCISPSIISGDVGCGISAVPLPASVVERRGGLQRLLNVIHENVPFGGGAAGVHQSPIIRLEQFQPFLDEATVVWREFARRYHEQFGVNIDAVMCAKYANFLPENNDKIIPFEKSATAAAAAAAVTDGGASASASSSSSSSSDEGMMGSKSYSSGMTDASSATGAIAGMMQEAEEGQEEEHEDEAGETTTGARTQSAPAGLGVGSVQNSAATSASNSGRTSKDRMHRKNTPQFQYSLQWLQKRCSEWGVTLDSIRASLATAGSGNHFCEVGVRTYSLDDHGEKSAMAADAAAAEARKRQKHIQRQYQGKEAEAEEDDDENDVQSLKHQAKGRVVEPPENEAALPEYLLSVHTGSRAVGGALFRFWTKRCEMLSIARAASAAASTSSSAASASAGGGGGASKAVAAANLSNSAASVAAAAAAAGDNNSSSNEVIAAIDAAAAAGPHAEDDDAELVPFNSLHLLTSPEDVAGYYLDMVWAQQFATMNRRAILSVILFALGDRVPRFDAKNMIETVHNYIDMRDLVIRKGAIKAELGKPSLIALNMKEGLWLCRGKDNPDWNGSAAHGCGRVVSRKAAAAPSLSGKLKGGKKGQAQDPKVKQFRDEMGDVLSQSVTAETYDERPSAYRNSALVRSLLAPAAHIICRYKVILSCKGSDAGGK